MKIGLALSGGGFRAAVFHLGVLARLSEENRLDEVAYLSTVSGGSLGIGLVHATNEFHWPSSSDFITKVVPKARELLITQDLQLALIWGVVKSILKSPLTLFESRAAGLSELLKTRWGVTASLSQLPDHPRWFVNATCYESGKDWRFEKSCVGDYKFGYTRETNKIPLSDALAASSGFPGLIGALAFDMTRYTWHDRCDDGVSQPDEPRLASEGRLNAHDFPTVHLWDGGVYDNNGLELFHNFDSPRWERGVEFLIVSDASGKAGAASYRIGVGALLHIITGVMMPQIRSLRARAVVALMRQQAKGGYLHIGNTCEQVLTGAKVDAEIVARLNAECLAPEVVARTERLQTEIRRLEPEEFTHLFQHGFEVADYTLFAYHPDQFKYIGYMHSRWPSIIL